MASIDRVQAAVSEEISRTKFRARVGAVRAAANVARDFLLFPTADADATPRLPDEPGDNLTPAQRLAVAALVSGESFAAAARSAGCSGRTLYNWRRQPAFARAVESRSREALGVVVVRVRNLMLRATRVLGDSMLDPSGDVAPRSAFRVLSSARLWTVMERSAEDEAKADAAAPETPAAPEPSAAADVVVDVATDTGAIDSDGR